MKTFLFLHMVMLGCLTFQSRGATTGDPLDRWNQDSADAVAPDHAISYGQRKWRGINRNNQLVSSINAREWSVTQTFPPEQTATEITFADGLWLIGGFIEDINGSQAPFIITSTDGEKWIPASFPSPESGWVQTLRYTIEGWVALLYSNSSRTDRLLRSRDGRNWTRFEHHGLPTNGSLQDLAYGNERWLGLAGYGKSLVSSANLIDWQSWPSPFPNVGYGGPGFHQLKFAHGLWFAIAGPTGSSEGTFGEFNILTSTDAVHWIKRYGGSGISDVTMADGRLVAVSSIGSVIESDPLLSLDQTGPGDLVVRRAAGVPVAVEFSDDLLRWQTLTNLPLGAPVEEFTDPALRITGARFYRARVP